MVLGRKSSVNPQGWGIPGGKASNAEAFSVLEASPRLNFRVAGGEQQPRAFPSHEMRARGGREGRGRGGVWSRRPYQYQVEAKCLRQFCGEGEERKQKKEPKECVEIESFQRDSAGVRGHAFAPDLQLPGMSMFLSVSLVSNRQSRATIQGPEDQEDMA